MLVVGLGNPGPDYEQTRHNIGFMAVDLLVERWNSSWSSKRSFARTRCNYAGRSLTLLKPQTFMNRSGDAVADQARFFNVPVPEIVVIHDELDLPFGSVRIKAGGGFAGHNGLRSIVDRTGSKDFLRVRVGIGRPDHKGMVSSYVLSRFAKEQRDALPTLLDGVADATEILIKEGISAAQRNIHPQNFFVS